MGVIIEHYQKVTELLRYFTGSIIITQATGKLASVGIGVGFTVGDIIQLSGTANSNIEATITYIHGDNSYILATANGGAAWGVGETAGAGKVNQVYYTDWQDILGCYDITAAISSSGALDAWLQQSWDQSDVYAFEAKVDVVGGTPKAFSEIAYCQFARLKLLTEDVIQSSMAAHFGGKLPG